MKGKMNGQAFVTMPGWFYEFQRSEIYSETLKMGNISLVY